MRNLFITFLLILFSLQMFAQDVVILKNGDIIEAKVLEIQLNEIKYKRFNHQNGPTITIAKNDVFLIKYENGMKEIISELSQSSKSDIKQKSLPAEKGDTGMDSSFRPKTTLKNQKAFQRTNNYTLFGGVSMPVGYFSSDVLSPGVHIGLENSFMYSSNFGLTSQLTVNYNKFISDGYYFFDAGLVSVNGLSGVRFGGGAGRIKIYGLALVGLDWTILTGDASIFGDGIHLAIGSGLGLTFNELLNVGIRFNHAFGTDLSTLQFSAGIQF